MYNVYILLLRYKISNFLQFADGTKIRDKSKKTADSAYVELCYIENEL